MIGAAQISNHFNKNLIIFAKISARDNKGSSNFKKLFKKTALFLRKSQLMITGAVQIFKTLQQNVLFLRKLQLLIIGAGQIFKSHQQNCFISGKGLPRDNRSSANCLVT